MPTASCRASTTIVGNHPPVFPLFWGFRIMVGTGLLMLAVSWSGRLLPVAPADACPGRSRWLLVPMALSGWVATLAGWYTTEIGRQPWLVTGVLKTADALGAGRRQPCRADACRLSRRSTRLLLVAYLGVLVHLALKAAKDGDASPLPAVLDRPLSQPAQKEG